METMNFPTPSDNTGGGFDVFGLLRRKFWTIAFFVLLATGLSVVYFLKAPKTFESTAKIFVDERNAPVSDGDAYQSETNVEQYVEILNSVAVMRAAVVEGQLDELESMADVEDVIENLRNNFSVFPSDTKGKSGVMQLAFRGPVPDDCEKVLRSVITAFDQYIDSNSSDRGGEVLEALKGFTDDMGTEFEELEKQIRELSAKPELQFRDGIVSNQHQIQQANLQEDLDKLRRDKTRLKARLDKIKQAEATGIRNDSMIADTLQELNEGALSGYVTTHQEYLRLRMREQELLGELGSEHPDLMALRNQIVVINQMRMQELATLRTGQSGDTIPDDYEVVTSLLETKIDLIDAESSSLSEEITREQTKAAAIASDVELLASLQRERERREQAYFAAVSNLKEQSALKDYEWRNMEVLDPPTAALQVVPGLLVSLAGGLLLGSLIGFGFVTLQEVAEKTFRSPNEIAQRLGTKVVAQIGDFRNRKKNPQYRSFGRDLIMLHDPGAIFAESFRALRTSLFFKSQKDGSRIIQITSPAPGDGKSQVSANLAIAVANSGRSVCLVDCDLRRPTQFDRFGVKNIVGLTSVLVGDHDLDSAVTDTGVPQLHFLPSGPKYANPSELLTSAEFPKLLQDLAEKFDFVIVDTPPVLPVTDPAIISNFVDTIFMVLRIRKGVQVNARRAVEALETVNASLDGVIVNGLRRKDGFGGKSGYGSAYGQYGTYGSYSNGGADKGLGKVSKPATEQREATRAG